MARKRYSRQRKLVLEAVRARRDHPTADQVFLGVRDNNPKISRGTVYRNLNSLAESCEVRHVRLPGVDADRYDWRLDQHYHLICTGCGKVLDAPSPYRTELDKTLAEQTGYRIACHRTVFEGLCPECQQKQSPLET